MTLHYGHPLWHCQFPGWYLNINLHTAIILLLSVRAPIRHSATHFIRTTGIHLTALLYLESVLSLMPVDRALTVLIICCWKLLKNYPDYKSIHLATYWSLVAHGWVTLLMVANTTWTTSATKMGCNKVGYDGNKL